MKKFLTPARGRLAMWLVFVLTSAGLFGGLKHEGHVREAQLCQVVINVHNNAKFRANTEHDNLRVTRQWLYDHRYVEKGKDDLTDRIRESLPNVEDRVRVADNNVHATTPPPVCQKYVKES